MVDLKPMIVNALQGSQSLAKLIGKDKLGLVKVYPETVPVYDKEPVTVPYITFFELTNFEATQADDAEIESEAHFHFDIWTKGNTGPIAIEVDKVMKELGFRRTSAGDRYDSGTSTYRKIMKYKTQIVLEE